MKPFSSKHDLTFSFGSFSDRAQARFAGLFGGHWMQLGHTSERLSLMKFSELGTLYCLCHPDRAVFSDRRGTCRVCGHEVRAKVVDDISMMDSKDIQSFVKQLNQMTKRTDGHEFVPAIEVVGELAN